MQDAGAHTRTVVIEESDRHPQAVSTWPERFRWLLLMPLVLTPPYLVSNHLTWQPASAIPMTDVDRWVPVGPQWTLAYLMLFPLMWAAVLSQARSGGSRQVVLSFTAAALTASLVFVLWPTSYARPGWTADGLYGWVVWLDTERNACPSLHGAFSVLGAWWLGRSGLGRSVAVVGWAMAGLILVATIGVRQHGVIDLGGGMLLGVVVAAIWHRIWPAADHCP